MAEKNNINEMEQLLKTVVEEGCPPCCSHEGCSTKDSKAYFKALNRIKELNLQIDVDR